MSILSERRTKKATRGKVMRARLSREGLDAEVVSLRPRPPPYHAPHPLDSFLLSIPSVETRQSSLGETAETVSSSLPDSLRGWIYPRFFTFLRFSSRLAAPQHYGQPVYTTLNRVGRRFGNRNRFIGDIQKVRDHIQAIGMNWFDPYCVAS